MHCLEVIVRKNEEAVARSFRAACREFTAHHAAAIYGANRDLFVTVVAGDPTEGVVELKPGL